MIFNTKLALLSLVALVAAQSSSSTSATSSGSASRSSESASAASSTPSVAAPDACIIGCVTPAAQAANCSSFADLKCVCTSTKFQSAAEACLQANCTTTDQQNALSLQKTQCASVLGSAGASGPSATSASNSTASGSAPAHTSSSSASTLVDNNMWALAAGVFGAAAAVAL